MKLNYETGEGEEGDAPLSSTGNAILCRCAREVMCTLLPVLCAKTRVDSLKNEADNRIFTVSAPRFEVGLIQDTSNRKADRGG